MAGAINGAAIARGTSFLKDRMGEQVAASGLTFVDDPLRPGAWDHACSMVRGSL